MGRGPTRRAGSPWYEGGLRFGCTECGTCCTGAPGYVWVTKEDVRAAARGLGLSPRAFRRRFVRRVGRRLSLRERENGDCVLLEGNRCTVYEAKPVRCSTFPFWPEVLASRETWEAEGERCEGIGRGALYAREDVARLLDGDATLLLARQAAAPPAPAPTRAPDEATWRAALADLAALYADLERELPAYGFTCAASGRCCDFARDGHRLYASTLEAEHFFRRAPSERQNGSEAQCPAWGKDRLCHAREGRMLGCRTYFCGPYPVARPEEVHEPWLRRVKAIHDRHGIPFAYRDIVEWAREREAAPRGADP